MPPLCFAGAWSSGHGCFPPSNCLEGSDDTFVNNIPVARIGDAWASHACPSKGSHTPTTPNGSGTVMVNNIGVLRIGDELAGCGVLNIIAQGSPDTLAGD